MPEFEYQAMELGGRQVSGVLAGASEREVVDELSRQSLYPTHIAPARVRQSPFARATGVVRAKDVATFYSQLSDLLRSGVPLLRALELLKRQCRKPALEGVLGNITETVADGSSLADAMGAHGRAFPDIAVSMVRAGEEGGFLEDSLQRIAMFSQHQQELKNRVIGAMVYPVFLVVVGSLMIAGVMKFFVPRFQPILNRFNDDGTLPWSTSALLSVSDFISRFGIWLVAVLLVAAVALVRRVQTDSGRIEFDRFRLQMPGLGPMLRSLSISRFCRMLGTLLGNGVPVLRALTISRDASGNRIISQAIAEAAEHVSSGQSLAKPLEASGQFPDDVIEMIAVGESANNLEHVLIDVAETMERRTWQQVDLLTRFLEPALLLIMGGVVLFIAAALLLPVMNLSGQF